MSDKDWKEIQKMNAEKEQEMRDDQKTRKEEKIYQFWKQDNEKHSRAQFIKLKLRKI